MKPAKYVVLGNHDDRFLETKASEDALPWVGAKSLE